MNRSSLSHNRSRGGGARSGFTLTELITVIAIITLVAGLATLSVRGVGESASFQRTLSQVSGLLEQTRAYAIANNTHAWVGFSENAATGESMVRMAAFASLDGTDLAKSGGGADVTLPSDSAEMISRMEPLENVKVVSDPPSGNKVSLKLPEVKALSALPSSGGGGGSTFAVKLPDSIVRFDRTIHFTPVGEAQFDTSLPEAIQFVLVPERTAGVSTVADQARAAVVRVSGLTGQVFLFQP